VRVELSSRGSLTAGESLRSGLGVVRVEQLWWTSSEIEIERCGGPLASLRRWLLPAAHAHGLSSPTRLAVPSVVSATLAGAAALGALTPPAGRYCSVRYRVGPADADTLGLSDAPEMRDQSFLLRGRFGTSAEELEPFELISQRAFDVTRQIDLELSAEHPQASLAFELDPERWFAGIDLGSLTGAAREEVLMASFRSALEVRVE
jgi:hypothetical protein